MHFEPLGPGSYLRFVEAWGTGDAGKRDTSNSMNSGLDLVPDYECGIVEAARQSTQGNFRGWEEDQKLLRHLYLSEPQHATPFEFSGMTVELQGPIIVFREWHRHRTQSYNEMSARYSPMPDNNYIPDWENLKQRGEKWETSRNKQEKGTHAWDEDKAKEWLTIHLFNIYAECEGCYQRGLQAGVPKEIARLCVPVGRYSRMRATANLRNWLAFMTLRYDPQAQWEIRQYAQAIGHIIAVKFPQVWRLYVEKQSPQHKLKKFTDEELREEMIRRNMMMKPFEGK